MTVYFAATVGEEVNVQVCELLSRQPELAKLVGLPLQYERLGPHQQWFAPLSPLKLTKVQHCTLACTMLQLRQTLCVVSAHIYVLLARFSTAPASSLVSCLTCICVCSLALALCLRDLPARHRLPLRLRAAMLSVLNRRLQQQLQSLTAFLELSPLAEDRLVSSL